MSRERFFLTYSYMRMYCFSMARAATTSDAFNAVAEPRRREILSYLALRERPVGEIVTELRIDQPSVSKHLRVLHSVDLVRMRCVGRHKFYRTNAEAIRPMHEWAGTFERYWLHQLLNVKKRAETQMNQEQMSQVNSDSEPAHPDSANPDSVNPSPISKEKP